MKRLSLQTRIFLTYTSLAGVVLLSVAVFFFTFVSRQLKTSQINAMNTLNAGFQSQVESAIRDLDAVSVNINYSSQSKAILNSSFDLMISGDMLSQMSELFISLSGTELKADQVNLYDFNGYVLESGISTMVKKTDGSREEYLSKAQELGGKKLLIGPYCTKEYSKTLQNDRWFISLYRSFINQYRRTVGVIETAKQCKSIFKSIITYQKKNSDQSVKIYIFDSDGNLIYPFDISQEDANVLLPYDRLTKKQSGNITLTSPLTGGTEYAARSVSSYTGYTYLTIMPKEKVLAPVYNLLRILTLMVILILTLSAFISYRLSRSVVRPIKHLKHIIQRMKLESLGQEQVTAYPVSVNELEELYQAFQMMSDSLKASMEQLNQAKEHEMQARSMALQTQINPHFYYNTLSNIMVLTENGDSETVMKMCRNLSQIMRYITDTKETIVSLKEELEYVQKYLYCMKVRYQSSLTYSIDVEESLLSQPVPKLLIQPIVENAIRHGSNCSPPWDIHISSTTTAESWQIHVVDSGPGFTKEALARIRDNIQKAATNPNFPELKINGLGTVNIYLRWSIFCKGKMIFTFGNTKTGHGIVSIGRYHSTETEETSL